MNVDKINKAVKAAQEFLNRVDAIARHNGEIHISGQPIFHAPSGKLNASLRRQSMELTRALSEMRRPG